MDIEKQVLELRTRINSLRAQLELNSTHDNKSSSSSEQSPKGPAVVSHTHSENPNLELSSSELLKAKLMQKRSSSTSSDSSSTSSWVEL